MDTWFKELESVQYMRKQVLRKCSLRPLAAFVFVISEGSLINLNKRNYKCILSPGDYKKDTEKRTFPFSLTYELALQKGTLTGHSLGVEQLHLGSQFHTGLTYGGSSPHLGNPDPPPGHSDSM